MLRLGLTLPFIATPSFVQTLYSNQSTPSPPQHACPTDTVVWLRTRIGGCYFQSERWHRLTEERAPVHKEDADSNVDQATGHGK
jgi:hypothetical protein